MNASLALAAALNDRCHGNTAALGQVAVKAHVGDLTIARATAGRLTQTIPYLRIAAVIHFDPWPRIAGPIYGVTIPFPEPSDFSFEMLSLGVRLAMRLQRHALVTGQRVIGVKPNVFKALIAGKPNQITGVLAACRYVGVHPFGYLIQANTPKPELYPPTQTLGWLAP